MTTFIPNPAIASLVARSEAVDHVCEEKAQKVADYAQQTAPVLTGAYRDSIHAVNEGEGARVVADIDYAIYLEVGTSDTPAFHTLGNALAAAEHL